MEKKTIAPTTTEQKTIISVPKCPADFQNSVLSAIPAICELKNRILLEGFYFTDKNLTPFTERFQSILSDFEVNMRDSMENLMSAYIILEELNAHRSCKFSDEKEVKYEI